MIIDMLKLFFASGFVSAAGLQAYVSSATWLDVHGLQAAPPRALSHAGPALALCLGLALVITAASSIRQRFGASAR